MPITDPRPHKALRLDLSWHDRAACRDEPIDLFFSAEGERAAERKRREMEAKAICKGCPVISDCLDQALSQPERFGLWGGLDEDERAAERRRRNRRRAAA